MQDSETTPEKQILNEVGRELRRDWKDEQKENFTNVLFAREGIMLDRVQRQQNYEEDLKQFARTGDWPGGPEENKSEMAVSVGNKTFNFHGAQNTPADASKKSIISKVLPPALLAVGGAAAGFGLPLLFDNAGPVARPFPAIEVRTGLRFPDGTVAPIRAELFDSTKFFPKEALND